MTNGFINRSLLCLFAVLTFFLFTVSEKAFAEQSAVLSAPDVVRNGESFDITLTFSADDNIGWFETNIIYDSKLLEYTGGSANGGEGNLHLRSFSESSVKAVTEKLTFKALGTGMPEISLLNCSVFSPDGVPMFTPSASVKLNIIDSSDQLSDSSSESSDEHDSSSVSESDLLRCTLKSLALSEGELSPAFSPDIFDYTVKLDKDVKKVEILSERAFKEDYIWFECSSWLSKTDDPKQIIVNIYDGDVKLKITVKDKEEDPKVTNIYRILFQTDKGEESSEAEDSSSVPDAVSKAETVTTVTTLPPQQSSTSYSRSTAAPKERSGMSELRDKLMPWLLVVLLVLVIALILVIYWIRSRTDRKRRKIKTTSRK